MSYTIRRKLEAAGVIPKNKTVPFEVLLADAILEGVTITPEIAQFLLDHHNKHNRPVKATRIDQYAMELKLGLWKYNGERILFDSDGQLLSGQHRLLAIVKSGVSMKVDIKFGLDPGVRDTIDTGAVRSTTDVRRLMTGNPDQAFIVKALNGVKKILNHRRTGTSAVLAEKLESDYSRGLKVATGLVKGRGGLGRGPSAGAIVLAAEAAPMKVKAFLEEVVTANPTTTAGRKLCQYVMGDFNNKNDAEDTVASKVLFAIHSHLTGKDFDRLQTSHHEEHVEYFLSIIKGNHALDTLDVVRPG